MLQCLLLSPKWKDLTDSQTLQKYRLFPKCAHFLNHIIIDLTKLISIQDNFKCKTSLIWQINWLTVLATMKFLFLDDYMRVYRL